MLQDISTSFAAQSYFSTINSPFLPAVLVLCFLLALIALFFAIRARRNKYIPHGYINNPRQIRNVFALALDQRCTVEIQPSSLEQENRPIVRTALLNVKQDCIVVELNVGKALSEYWLSKELLSFFRLKVDNTYTYFTFTSTIQGIASLPGGMCHLTLAIPVALENRQKRSFLRLSLPTEFILGSTLWVPSSLPEFDIITNINQWPNPLLFLLPQRKEDYSIADISAGGLRVIIPKKTTTKHNLVFGAGENILLLLDLLDSKTNNPLRLWIRCRIQNAWEDYKKQNVLLGLQFNSWARPKIQATPDEISGGIEWLKLSSTNEIEAIGNWIMQRHLDQVRNTSDERHD